MVNNQQSESQARLMFVFIDSSLGAEHFHSITIFDQIK